ncbi:MAG: hydrogenase maturation nickel metallochaperone HypA [Oscillospiraceae bacterium]|nr:hydrogenase maturation nickel metallochaperone HypA [Oscillospiraceae bacterium]
MHEIGVLNEAVKTIEKVASDNNISNIKQVTLEVGELSGYLPVFFEKYFDVLTENKPLFKDCELKIIVETGEGLCSDCHALYNVLKHEGICPKCKSRNKTILSGQQFLVKNISY